MTDKTALLSYAQKQEFLKFLADPSNWENRFDEDFLLDKDRKANVAFSDGYAIALNDKRDQGWIAKHGLSSRLFFEQKGSKLTITDESGKTVTLNRSGKGKPIGKDKPPKDWEEEFELPSFQLTICITEDGRKLLRDQITSRFIEFDAPHPDYYTPFKGTTSHFHAVSIDELTAMQRFELRLIPLFAAAKLILGRELGLQPSMKGVNELQPFTSAKTIYVEEGDDHAKAMIDAHEAGWHDSTEFSGHRLELAKRFFINETDDGFELRTHFGHKARILNFGHLLEQALNGNMEAIVLSDLAANPFREGISLQGALHLTSNGRFGEDKQSRPWRYVLLKTPQAPALASLLRELFRDQIGIDDDHYCALNIDQHKCLLAINEDAYQALRQGYDATMELLRLAREGTLDDKKLETLLEKGANPKFLPASETQVLLSVTDMLKEAGYEGALSSALHPVKIGRGPYAANDPV